MRNWCKDLPRADHNVVACSAFSRTAAELQTALSSPPSHICISSVLQDLCIAMAKKRNLWDCGGDEWCLLYRWHPLFPWTLLGSAGCVHVSVLWKSQSEFLISCTFSELSLSLHLSCTVSGAYPLAGSKSVVLEGFWPSQIGICWQQRQMSPEDKLFLSAEWGFPEHSIKDWSLGVGRITHIIIQGSKHCHKRGWIKVFRGI